MQCDEDVTGGVQAHDLRVRKVLLDQADPRMGSTLRSDLWKQQMCASIVGGVVDLYHELRLIVVAKCTTKRVDGAKWILPLGIACGINDANENDRVIGNVETGTVGLDVLGQRKRIDARNS